MNIKYSLCDVKKKLKLSVFLSYFILFMYFFNRKSHTCSSHRNSGLLEQQKLLYLCTTYCEFTLYKFPPLYTQNIAGGLIDSH